MHEAEDAKAFHERMQQVDTAVEATLTKLHNRAENQQSTVKGHVYKPAQLVWVWRPDRRDKLSTFWTGPHKISRRVGHSVWEVDVGNKCRNVHEAQMQPWYPPVEGEASPLHHHMLTDDPEGPAAPDEWLVEKILRHRQRPDGSYEFLTRWQGFKPDDDTLEPAKNFLQKVNIDWLQYCRQHKIDFKVMDHMKHLLTGSQSGH